MRSLQLLKKGEEFASFTKLWARSIRSKFPETPVQNRMGQKVSDREKLEDGGESFETTPH